MPAYRLRLTPDECNDDVLVGFLKEHATVWVAVHHTPASGDGEDRPHYHAYIETK